ncbi:MAG: MBL fold metallo-hydrolase [Desulfotalea sp.]
MIGTIKQLQAGFCFSYLLNVDDNVIIIDPHLSLLSHYQKELQGKKLVAVLDTHTHADHISCAMVLSKESNAPLLMSNKAVSALPITRLDDGDKFPLLNTELEIIATPGHTDDSISILWQGNLFTGDTLLINSIGRCDFQNGSPKDLYSSLQKIKELPSETVIYPAHDYNKLKSSTLDKEFSNNKFLKFSNSDDFITLATAKEIPKPANMDNIIALNQSGEAGKINKIEAGKVAQLIKDDNWLLVDVRSAEECASISIKGALNIPLLQISARIKELPKDKKIILTCKTGSRAMRAVSVLMGSGYPDLYLLDGAILAWQKAGLPVVKTGPAIPLQQQILVVAGTMVTSGIVGAYFINSYFILLSLMAGLGLMFAGLTGICMMGEILLRAPWNKIEPIAPSTGGGCSISSENSGGCSVGSNTDNSSGGCSL